MKHLLTTAAIFMATQLASIAGPDVIESHDHGSHDHGSHGHGEKIDYLGADFTRGWFEKPALHDHGRYIHPLTIEAAFNDNDFFLDYAFNSFEGDVEEHEIELEVELALSRRIGLVLGTAYIFETEEGSTSEGFGDLELAFRFVLLEHERSITTANVGFGLPTGSDLFTADEVVLEPGILNWFDLGNGFTLNTAVGFEIGVESDDFELGLDAALIKRFNRSFAASLEFRNVIGLQDEESGDVTSEATLGGIFRINAADTIRAGWSFPVSSDEFEGGAVLSFDRCF